MVLISHLLIGCPSSGKTTIANELVRLYPNCRIISTDQIREKLFGDENIQGDWELIENEVFFQIQNFLEAGHSIIYDATNAKRHWRKALLQQYNNIQWIAWNLKTPLEVCLQWNQNRKRQVPNLIIEDLYNSLLGEPPSVEEGFTEVYEIPYVQGRLDLTQLDQLQQFLIR